MGEDLRQTGVAVVIVGLWRAAVLEIPVGGEEQKASTFLSMS
jgi:hypothetical protein